MKEQDFQRHLQSEQQKSRRLLLQRCALSLATMAALILLVYYFQIPNPNMILITGLTVFTSLYGYPCGVVCGSAMILYSMFFFSEGHSFFAYTPVNLQKISVISLGVAMNVLLIGGLKQKNVEYTRRILEMNELLQLDNDTLEEASSVDTLTGVRNRYALRRDYPGFEGKILHVMMLDLDNFKQVNDRYGHPVGDYVLRSLGSALADAFGAENCYRYGGDEFLVLCVNLLERDFLQSVTHLRETCSGICLKDQPLNVQLSCGYVYGRCETRHDLRLMLHQADNCLYQAKRGGKNRSIGTSFNRSAAQSLQPHDTHHRIEHF